MIHLDRLLGGVRGRDGVFFFFVKMIALVFDRQPPGNDHNPPPTSHVEVSGSIIDSKMPKAGWDMLIPMEGNDFLVKLLYTPGSL